MATIDTFYRFQTLDNFQIFLFFFFFLSNYPSKRISKNRKTLVICKIPRDLSFRSISSYIYSSTIKIFQKPGKKIFFYIYIYIYNFFDSILNFSKSQFNLISSIQFQDLWSNLTLKKRNVLRNRNRETTSITSITRT